MKIRRQANRFKTSFPGSVLGQGSAAREEVSWGSGTRGRHKQVFIV